MKHIANPGSPAHALCGCGAASEDPHHPAPHPLDPAEEYCPACEHARRHLLRAAERARMRLGQPGGQGEHRGLYPEPNAALLTPR
jgi:hypothetical protein